MAVANNKLKASHAAGGIFLMFGFLSSCGQGRKSSELHRVEQLVEEQIAVGSRIQEGLFFLRSNGFTCIEHVDRSLIRQLPSFICRRSLKHKQLAQEAISTITVSMDADKSGIISDSQIIVTNGGLKSL